MCTSQNRPSDKEGNLYELYTRTWFHRFWTLQELTLSRRALVICGHFSLLWQTFANVGFVYFPTMDDALISFLTHYATNKIFQMGPQNLVIHSGEYQGFILRYIRNHRASEPRDRIYGISSIFTRTGWEIADLDYSKPLAQVYREATYSYITTLDVS